eukprot:g5590.t1
MSRLGETDRTGRTPPHSKRTKRDTEEFISPALKVLRDHHDLIFVLAEYLDPRSRINARTALQDKEGWIPKQVLEYVEEKREKGEGLKWEWKSLKRVVKEDKFELVKWAGTFSEYVKKNLCEQAARFGKLHMLKWAKKQEPPLPWSENECALAFVAGHYDTLKWLIEKGCPCSDQQRTDFLRYVHMLEGEEEWKNVDVNEVLLEFVGNYGGSTILMMACHFVHMDLVRHLLARNGVNVNQGNKWGRTALHLASKEGHIEVVKAILSHPKTNVNQANDPGQNAFHLASTYGHLKVVKAILSHPKFTNANHADKYGSTALHFASEDGHIEVVKAILSHPKFTNANQVDVYEQTALHKAILSGHIEVAMAILSHPKFTNVNQVDTDRNTALHLASEEGHIEVVKAILSHPKFTNVNQKESKLRGVHQTNTRSGPFRNASVQPGVLQSDPLLERGKNDKNKCDEYELLWTAEKRTETNRELIEAVKRNIANELETKEGSAPLAGGENFMRYLTEAEMEELEIEREEVEDYDGTLHEHKVLRWMKGESARAPPFIHNVWVGGVMRRRVQFMIAMNLRTLALNIRGAKKGFSVMIWFAEEFNRPNPSIYNPTTEDQAKTLEENIARVKVAVDRANLILIEFLEKEMLNSEKTGELEKAANLRTEITHLKEHPFIVLHETLDKTPIVDTSRLHVYIGRIASSNSEKQETAQLILDTNLSEMCATFFNEVRGDSGVGRKVDSLSKAFLIDNIKYLFKRLKRRRRINGEDVFDEIIVQPAKFEATKRATLFSEEDKIKIHYDNGYTEEHTIEEWQKIIEQNIKDFGKMKEEFNEEKHYHSPPSQYFNKSKLDAGSSPEEEGAEVHHPLDYVDWIKTYGLWAGISDVLRLEILYQYGGMYHDIDDVLIGRKFHQSWYGKLLEDVPTENCNVPPSDVGDGLQYSRFGVRATVFKSGGDNNDVIIAPQNSPTVKEMKNVIFKLFKNMKEICFGHDHHHKVMDMHINNKITQARCIMDVTGPSSAAFRALPFSKEMSYMERPLLLQYLDNFRITLEEGSKDSVDAFRSVASRTSVELLLNTEKAEGRVPKCWDLEKHGLPPMEMTEAFSIENLTSKKLPPMIRIDKLYSRPELSYPLSYSHYFLCSHTTKQYDPVNLLPETYALVATFDPGHQYAEKRDWKKMTELVDESNTQDSSIISIQMNLRWF